jgi:hypothetical protein
VNSKYLVLKERIIEELVFVKRSMQKAEEAWNKAKIENDDCYYDSTALNLHHMYNGIERIFEQIARNVDESYPEGSNWHRDLLVQMTLNIPKLRPRVISDDLFIILNEFRSFRHVVRNIYTFQYDLDKINTLIALLKESSTEIFHEFDEFNTFLSASFVD